LLAGPGKHQKKLDAETINNSKVGEIEADGVQGTFEYDEGGRRHSAEYEARTHESAPFGLVTIKFTVRSERDGMREVAVATLTLSDTGDTALSDLPSQR
jgi:hypothetical protein